MIAPKKGKNHLCDPTQSNNWMANVEPWQYPARNLLFFLCCCDPEQEDGEYGTMAVPCPHWRCHFKAELSISIKGSVRISSITSIQKTRKPPPLPLSSHDACLDTRRRYGSQEFYLRDFDYFAFGFLDIHFCIFLPVFFFWFLGVCLADMERKAALRPTISQVFFFLFGGKP